jgi:hypothetical protein
MTKPGANSDKPPGSGGKHDKGQKVGEKAEKGTKPAVVHEKTHAANINPVDAPKAKGNAGKHK